MNAILVAKTSDNRLFYLHPHISREKLTALKANKQFFCPGCEEPLLLKVGSIKIPHFAHISLSDCSASSESESPMHLHGKTMLHEFFSQKNLKAELERYFPQIKQRTDLLVNEKIAVEFQCSPIPLRDIEARSNGYLSLGIQPLWLLCAKESIHEGIYVIKLKSFEQALLQEHNGYRFVIALDPVGKRFYYYSCVFQLNGLRWIAKVKSLAAEKQSFPFALPKKLTEMEFAQMYDIALAERQKFIRNQHYVKNRFRSLYWRLCYELRLDANSLPLTIGIPLTGNHLMAEASVLWQLQAVQFNAKGLSMKQLLADGQIKLAEGTANPEALELLERYMKIYSLMKKQGNNQELLLELLYHIYCKSV